MPDRAILARCIHTLKDEQQSVAVRSCMQVLERTQFFDVTFESLPVVLL
jgi:hypothetical protein